MLWKIQAKDHSNLILTKAKGKVLVSKDRCGTSNKDGKQIEAMNKNYVEKRC